MINFSEKLQNFDETNFSRILYEFGFASDEIKQFIIEEFSDYFENRRKLEENTLENLTTVWFSFLSIERDFKESLIYLSIILEIYNSAKKNNSYEAFNGYAEWFPDFSQSITRFWSIYFGQKKYDELSNEDYLSEITQLIGQSIEGCGKPFLQFTLFLNRIKRNKNADVNEIKSKDLGIIIDELINTSELKSLLVINNIRLNQWRNICYHHNTKIIDGKMYYYLKQNNNIESFEISREELKLIAREIQNLFKLIRIAETIFFIDNQNEIQEQINKTDTSEVNFRKESLLINFYNSINSQGFNVSNLQYDENLASMDLIDLERYSDITKKAIHSSQLLYNLWTFTKSKTLRINYFLYNNIKFFSSEISSANFEKDLDNSFVELMKDVKFTYINKDIQQNINPFENLILPNDENSQQFYSQKGEKITIEMFVKQFVLSTFCNFLAMEAEDFTNLKINVGIEGSLIISETPSCILVVPARISCKMLQQTILETLDNIIKLYKNNLLTLEIVNEAKEQNNYYDKLLRIKEQKKNF